MDDKGDDFQCIIPFVVRKSSSSELTKLEMLSVAIMSGIPNWANSVFKC